MEVLLFNLSLNLQSP